MKTDINSRMSLIKYLVLIGILITHFFASSCSNIVETSVVEWEVENDTFVSDLSISDIDLAIVNDLLYVAVASRVDGIISNGVVTQYELNDFGWEVEGDSGFTAGNSTELNQFYWENELYVSGVQGSLISGTPFLYTYDGLDWEDEVGTGVSSESISGATFLTYNGTLYSVYGYSNDLYIKSQNSTFGDWNFIQDNPFIDDPIIELASEFSVNINSGADSTTSSIWVAYRDEDVNGELSVSIFDLEGNEDNQELIGDQGFSDEVITSPYLTWVNDVLTVSYLNESNGLEIWQHVDGE